MFFQRRKRKLQKAQRTMGSILKKPRGSFANEPTERVLAIGGHWISIQRIRLDWGLKGDVGGENSGSAMAGLDESSPEFTVPVL
jgi:hypothetical protein